MYKNIIEDGHTPGNHTYDHLNGWKEKDRSYLQNIFKAKEIIDSNLFRPPYGRITRFQLITVMWDVLSGDFDKNVSAENCFLNVARNAKPGSIIVFHDSEKSFTKLLYALPKVLEYFSQKGYEFKGIEI